MRSLAGAQFMINSNVMVREVDDGAVLLHLDEGIYFGLDPIGLRVWHLLAENQEAGKIIDTLFDEYEVSRSELEKDVSNLLGDLTKNGLLV